MKKIWLAALLTCLFGAVQQANACTGISLQAADGSPVIARTIEWAGSDLNSRYVVVPRGYQQRSYTPSEQKDGMLFTAKHGYVGLAVERDEFVVDGMNEAGLSAALFYFPKYGKYQPFDSTKVNESISDMQLVSWVLSRFSSVDEAIAGIRNIRVVATDPRSSTVHWRITDRTGRQIVVEIVDEHLNIYENTVGVLTNSPGFDWHRTNLNNYINLGSGTIAERQVGKLTLESFGGGSGLHGLPGDMTPPSRFIRAAFFQATAPTLPTAQATVEQAFHILNNFDLPIGLQFAEGQPVPDIPSATQWTIATDLHNGRIYYRTMYNSRIRCIDLKTIDFRKAKYYSAPLDKQRGEQIEMVITQAASKK